MNSERTTESIREDRVGWIGIWAIVAIFSFVLAVLFASGTTTENLSELMVKLTYGLGGTFVFAALAILYLLVRNLMEKQSDN